MTLVLRMDLNNDAFTGRGRRNETGRILSELVHKIRVEPLKVGTIHALMDVNGNTVGCAKFFDEDTEDSRIVVIVEGGIVQDVFADCNGEYTVIDHDSEDTKGPAIGSYATKPLETLDPGLRSKI